MLRTTSGAAGGAHARAPFVPRGLDRLVARAHDRQHRHEAGDVEDALHAGLDGLADADDEALRGLERPAARVQQRAEHGGVHERRGR